MVANIIRVLASHNVPLTDTLIMEAYTWVVASETGVEAGVNAGLGLIGVELGERMVAAVTGLDVSVAA